MSGVRVQYAQRLDGSTDQPRLKEWADNFAEIMRALNVRPPDFFWEIAGELDMDIHLAGQSGSIGVQGAFAPPAGTESVVGQQLPAQFKLQTAAVSPDPSANPATAEELLQRFSGDAIRIYLAQHHYRSPWTHDPILLEKAVQLAERLSAAMDALSTGDRPLNVVPVQNRFQAALDNDLDTVKAIATLLNLADEILFRAANDYQVEDAQVALRQMASVFGLRLDRRSPEGRVIAGWRNYQEQISLAGKSPAAN
jgi:cysteinyl-tRNA synthetase